LWIFQAKSFHVEHARMEGFQYNPMHDPYFYHYWKTTESSTTTTPEPTETEPTTTQPEHGLSWGVEVGDRIDFSVTNTLSIDSLVTISLARTLKTGDDFYYTVTDTPDIPPTVDYHYIIMSGIEGDFYWMNGTPTEFTLGFEVLPVGNWSLMEDLLSFQGNISETTNTFTLSAEYTSGFDQFSMHGEIVWYKSTGELVKYHVEVTNSTSGENLGVFTIQNKDTTLDPNGFEFSEFVAIAITAGSVIVIVVFGALILRNRGYRPS
ncbi:MAG: hypothetical protein RTU92_07375, partial [Candidatus Thorarchaeota archaeon]